MAGSEARELLISVREGSLVLLIAFCSNVFVDVIRELRDVDRLGSLCRADTELTVTMESVSISNGRASFFDIVAVDGYSFLPHLLFPCFNLHLLSSICLFDFAGSLEFFVARAFCISIAAKQLINRTFWGAACVDAQL